MHQDPHTPSGWETPRGSWTIQDVRLAAELYLLPLGAVPKPEHMEEALEDCVESVLRGNPAPDDFEMTALGVGQHFESVLNSHFSYAQLAVSFVVNRLIASAIMELCGEGFDQD